MFLQNPYAQRFKNIMADPLNKKIHRVPNAGQIIGNHVVMCNGLLVEKNSYYGQFSKIFEMNGGVHEPGEEYVFYETIKSLKNQEPLIVELGCYWSYYSMCFLKENPNGKCFLVDENQNFLSVGQRHFTTNGFDGEFVTARVSNTEWRVDDYVKKRNIKKIDILLSDIQGFETEMIQGAKESMESKIIDYFFISTHSQKIHLDITKELLQSDYKIMASADFDNETYCHDGILIACSPNVNFIQYDLGNRSLDPNLK